MDIKKVVEKGNFDLHLHTTASDGKYSPSEVVQMAAEKGMNTIAITDHDTTKGIAEAINAGKAFGITVIPGIELSTKYKDKTIDILGYGINETPELSKVLERSRQSHGRRDLNRRS
ncbi:PHP domain-containing protein [Cytobacillus sp.]|uniref:PHP domain-containing protein n=1 Tax=Cytobacillus sp. TaxID=2675269 RepID=UPI0035172CE3